jgi:hypothetical protein
MSKYTKTIVSFEFACALCTKPFIANSGNHKYCSKSCEQSFNRRNRGCECPGCGNIKHRTSSPNTLCPDCKTKELKKLTIKEYLDRVSARGGAQNKLAAMRGLGRSWNKQILLEPCAHCGYNKHVQLAHKRPLTDFPDTALLEEVHSPDNVIALCPNCHWEFDHPKE